MRFILVISLSRLSLRSSTPGLYIQPPTPRSLYIPSTPPTFNFGQRITPTPPPTSFGGFPLYQGIFGASSITGKPTPKPTTPTETPTPLGMHVEGKGLSHVVINHKYVLEVGETDLKMYVVYAR